MAGPECTTLCVYITVSVGRHVVIDQTFLVSLDNKWKSHFSESVSIPCLIMLKLYFCKMMVGSNSYIYFLQKENYFYFKKKGWFCITMIL